MRAVSILLWALALLIYIIPTLRTISSFRCSHDIISEMSKSGKMKLPKSFKFHSFVLTKQKGFGVLSLDRILDPPVIPMSIPPMPHAPGTLFHWAFGVL